MTPILLLTRRSEETISVLSKDKEHCDVATRIVKREVPLYVPGSHREQRLKHRLFPVGKRPLPEMSKTEEDIRMSTEDNKAVVRRFYEEVVNQKKRAALDEVFDPNVVDHFAPPLFPGSRRQPD
jgi:hypothetical protein